MVETVWNFYRMIKIQRLIKRHPPCDSLDEKDDFGLYQSHLLFHWKTFYEIFFEAKLSKYLFLRKPSLQCNLLAFFFRYTLPMTTVTNPIIAKPNNIPKNTL